MRLISSRYLHLIFSFALIFSVFTSSAQQQSNQQPPQQNKPPDIQQFNNRFGKNDTIWSQVIIYKGDTIPARTYAEVDIYHYMSHAMRKRIDALNRLRNAVYVTYPYARKAGIILNDMNSRLARMNSESEKTEYIKSMEKALKKEFTDPMEKLSVYQGKVLMKLINRQTGNNCYEIIKEYRGGFSARILDGARSSN